MPDACKKFLKIDWHVNDGGTLFIMKPDDFEEWTEDKRDDWLYDLVMLDGNPTSDIKFEVTTEEHVPEALARVARRGVI